MVGERPQHQAWQCSEASYRVSLMLMDKIVWGNSSKLKAGVIASSALYEEYASLFPFSQGKIPSGPHTCAR